MRAWADVLLFLQLPSGIPNNRSKGQGAAALASYRATLSQNKRNMQERGATNGVLTCQSLMIYPVVCNLDTFVSQRYPLRCVGGESERLYTSQQKGHSQQEVKQLVRQVHIFMNTTVYRYCHDQPSKQIQC